MKKRSLAAATAASVLLGGILAGCSEGGQTDGGSSASPSGGESPKPITFTWMLANRSEGPVKQDWEIFKEIEKKTGVKIEFQGVDAAGATEKKNIMIATNTVTDFLEIGNHEGRTYGPENVFLNLKEYLDIAPNIKKFFDDNPEAKALATASDGGYYTIPRVESLPDSKGFDFAWLYRKDLADKYGLKPPTTVDEFYQFLKGFKQNDPNLIPLTFNVPLVGKEGAYGNFSRMFTGITGFIEQTPDDEQYTFAPYHKGFKDMLLFMNKLYAEKLLDTEYPLLTTDQFRARITGGKSAVTYTWKSNIENYAKIAQSAGIKDMDLDAFPLIAADGVKKYQFSRNKFGDVGLAISANVKDKKAAVKYLDFLIGEEGATYLSLGILDKSYKVVDGKKRYNEEFGFTPYTPLRRDYGVWYPGIATNFGIAREAWENGLDEKSKAVNIAYEKFIVPAPKAIAKTTEELELEKSKRANLDKYLEQRVTEFVVGKAPINDQTLKDLIDQSKKLGVDELLNMYNKAYKRTYGGN
ncbi:extracellular solute-binding protein [Paenibacillus puerhi]|uniref:extracellular solute-binding protein n=1 Tax=Paenibacillus puerhi TaxID=2692622 RepID=UPI001357B677|nr:extracellular solute-binding protein [Paenibacillus puerhi]